jgi:hypothetical protein
MRCVQIYFYLNAAKCKYIKQSNIESVELTDSTVKWVGSRWVYDVAQWNFLVRDTKQVSRVKLVR